jgi:hypothetical protein
LRHWERTELIVDRCCAWRARNCMRSRACTLGNRAPAVSQWSCATVEARAGGRRSASSCGESSTISRVRRHRVRLVGPSVRR